MAAARPARAPAPALQLRGPPRLAPPVTLYRVLRPGHVDRLAAFPPGTRMATVVAILRASAAGTGGFLVSPIGVGAWELDPSPPRPATPLAMPASRVHLSDVSHSFHPTTATVWLAQARDVGAHLVAAHRGDSDHDLQRALHRAAFGGAFAGVDGITLHPLTPYAWPIGRTMLQLAADVRSVDHRGYVHVWTSR